MASSLGHAHQRTLDAIVSHPSPHNLHWRDVTSLLHAATQVSDEANGKLRSSYQGRTLLLHPESHGDTVGAEDVASLRRLFRGDPAHQPEPTRPGLNVLIVIDHAEARLYRTELRGTTPERIEPFNSTGHDRYALTIHNEADGRRKPEVASYYEAIAKAIVGADRILIFGSGTGGSSAMDHLHASLNAHHKEIASKIVGTVVIDEHHLTENELLSKAREFYGRPLGRNAAET